MSCIIVLGCYRSGTSAIAGVLHYLGVMMGKEFGPPSHANVKGYFEDLEFMRLFDQLAKGDQTEKLLENLIRIRELEYSLWGVKDPKLCLVLPKFLRLLKTEPKIIAISRPKEDICASMANAIGYSEPKTYEPLVEHYLQNLHENFCDYDGKKIEVSFYEIIDNPRRLVEYIAKFIGVPVTEAALAHLGVVR